MVSALAAARQAYAYLSAKQAALCSALLLEAFIVHVAPTVDLMLLFEEVIALEVLEIVLDVMI